MERLAMITLVRQELSSREIQPDLGEVIHQTSIVEVVFSILADEGAMHFLKLEAGWILTNLAYGSEEELKVLTDFGGYGKPSFVEIMTNLL
jgi:hypothetical protein